MGSVFSPGNLLAPLFRAIAIEPVEAAKEVTEDHPADKRLLFLTHAERVTLAFAEVDLTANEKAALRALLDNPGSTGTELSAICGWTDMCWMNRMMLICQRRRHILWPDGVGADATKAILIGALASYNADTLKFRPREDILRILVNAVAGVAS